ncbi:MAG: DUF2135 domain-containing protein [Deltaproteobacteria bacterium]|nr:DUF2135 domain-containing protein [Deltaproteobacteria bacterium]
MIAVLLSLVLSSAPPNERQEGVPIGKGTTLATVKLDEPRGGWSVDRMIMVKGSVSDTTVDPIVISINGDRYLMRTFHGRFERKFPASTGKNIVTAMATNKAGTATAQATAYAQVPVVPMKVVLTSDTDGVYTDLHLYEPTNVSEKDRALDYEKMAHVYWANTASPSGGTFFLNDQGGSFDQPGYGPYLYIHRAPPKGVFLITTNYWPSGDKAHTIGTLNLTLFEGTAQELKRRVNVPLATPGTTQVLAWVNFVDGQKALVYVPGQDPVPSGALWPKNLEEVALKATKSGGGGGDYGGEF